MEPEMGTGDFLVQLITRPIQESHAYRESGFDRLTIPDPLFDWLTVLLIAVLLAALWLLAGAVGNHVSDEEDTESRLRSARAWFDEAIWGPLNFWR